MHLGAAAIQMQPQQLSRHSNVMSGYHNGHADQPNGANFMNRVYTELDTELDSEQTNEEQYTSIR
jgi:hypothetical protein